MEVSLSLSTYFISSCLFSALLVFHFIFSVSSFPLSSVPFHPSTFRFLHILHFLRQFFLISPPLTSPYARSIILFPSFYSKFHPPFPSFLFSSLLFSRFHFSQPLIFSFPTSFPLSTFYYILLLISSPSFFLLSAISLALSFVSSSLSLPLSPSLSYTR